MMSCGYHNQLRVHERAAELQEKRDQRETGAKWLEKDSNSLNKDLTSPRITQQSSNKARKKKSPERRRRRKETIVQ